MPRNNQPFLPLNLLVLDILGIILASLGYFNLRGDADLFPDLLHFDHLGSKVLIGIGVFLIAPAMFHLFKGVFTKALPNTASISDEKEQEIAKSDAVIATLPIEDFSGKKPWYKRPWLREWLVDLGMSGLVLLVLYPVAPTYPPFKELNVTKGMLSFPKYGSRPIYYPIALDGETYRCRAYVHDTSDCLRREDRERYLGNEALVHWYEQSWHFGKKWRVAMQVEVESKMLIDYRRQAWAISEGYKFSLWSSIIGFLVLLALLRLRRYLDERKGDRDSKSK